MVTEVSEEVLGSVDGELTGINDVPKDLIDGTDDHLLQFVKGFRVLMFFQEGARRMKMASMLAAAVRLMSIMSKESK